MHGLEIVPKFVRDELLKFAPDRDRLSKKLILEIYSTIPDTLSKETAQWLSTNMQELSKPVGFIDRRFKHNRRTENYVHDSGGQLQTSDPPTKRINSTVSGIGKSNTGVGENPSTWAFKQPPTDITLTTSEPVDNRQRYVVGFMFDTDLKTVVLIRKTKPLWQSGFWNGVGGKVEDGEDWDSAMSREFDEETDLLTCPSNWEHKVTLNFPHALIRVFKTVDGRITKCRTLTEEVVRRFRVSNLGSINTLQNITWLIGMCLDTHIVKVQTIEGSFG